MDEASMAHTRHAGRPTGHDPGHPYCRYKGYASGVHARDAEAESLFQAGSTAAGLPHQNRVYRGDLACESMIDQVTAMTFAPQTITIGYVHLPKHSIRDGRREQKSGHMTPLMRTFFG